ncbi:hypothetical protein LCGC14_0774180 [marine sediment metagenome]|uniref:Uncharacterized protein n=1 Tax=marine sediment metagenome TaxID=412755 RepID=A0A0F9PXN0_9ZZZZ
MKHLRFFKLALWKTYFDVGFGFLYYPKYFLFLVGVGDIIQSGGDYWRVLIAGFIIFWLCLFTGWAAYKYGWLDAVHEVQNLVDPFAKDMRATIKRKV